MKYVLRTPSQQQSSRTLSKVTLPRRFANHGTDGLHTNSKHSNFELSKRSALYQQGKGNATLVQA